MLKQKSAFRAALMAAAVLALSATLIGQVAQSATSQPGQVRQATSQPAAATAALQYQQLVEDLSADSMEGRGPRTAGIVRARDYVLERFRRAGLTPAFGESYLQAFTIRLGVTVEEQTLTIAAGRNAGAAAEPTRDFLPLGFAGSGSFDGPAVFVGYGIVDPGRKYDSYDGAAADALKGKVAIAFRFEPLDKDGKSQWIKAGPTETHRWTDGSSLPNKAAWAVSRGAAALLVVNPPSNDAEKSPRPVEDTAGGPTQSIPVIHITSRLFERMVARAGYKDAAGQVRKWQANADAGRTGVEPLEGVTVRGKLTIKPLTGTLHNVAGLLPGSGRLVDEIVVVGAHYDHLGTRKTSGSTIVMHGADDNASGTAGLLMMIQWLAGQQFEGAAAVASRGNPTSRPDAGQPADRRTVLFAAFSGEEIGLLGSAHMAGRIGDVKLPGGGTGKIVEMVDLDMIGRLRGDRLYVQGVDSGDRWRQIVGEAAKDSKLDVKMGGSGLGPSDHASFYTRKVPVLFFFTGGHPDVHRTTDTADKINAAGAVRVLRVVEALVERIRCEATPVAYVAPKGGPAVAAGRGTAFLGVMPDPADDETAAGASLAEVIDGGPADNAGLKAGDAIVRWNGKELAGVEALTLAVGAQKPGDVVKLQVRRDGKWFDAEVKLGTR